MGVGRVALDEGFGQAEEEADHLCVGLLGEGVDEWRVWSGQFVGIAVVFVFCGGLAGSPSNSN